MWMNFVLFVCLLSYCVFVYLICVCVCVCVWSRQQVLKWVLKEPFVLRLVSNPVCSVYGGHLVWVFQCAAAKCQTMCVSKYAQGHPKERVSVYSVSFYMGDCVY